MDRYDQLLKPYKDKVEYFISEINRLLHEPKTDENKKVFLCITQEAVEFSAKQEFDILSEKILDIDIHPLYLRKLEIGSELSNLLLSLYGYDSSTSLYVLKHLVND
nr:hypothetical protein [uncultured Fluviicola sp.]